MKQKLPRLYGITVWEAGGQDGAKMFCIAWSWNKNYHAYMELLFGIYGRCFLAVGDILWAYFQQFGPFRSGKMDQHAWFWHYIYLYAHTCILCINYLWYVLSLDVSSWITLATSRWLAPMWPLSEARSQLAGSMPLLPSGVCSYVQH